MNQTKNSYNFKSNKLILQQDVLSHKTPSCQKATRTDKVGSGKQQPPRRKQYAWIFETISHIMNSKLIKETKENNYVKIPLDGSGTKDRYYGENLLRVSNNNVVTQQQQLRHIMALLGSPKITRKIIYETLLLQSWKIVLQYLLLNCLILCIFT